MTQLEGSRARAVADLGEGLILASVEVRATAERVFDALTSEEAITRWWVRPGVFDTRQWAGEVSVGGRWSASGVGAGIPYALEGEFLQVEAPRKLIHSWHGVLAPGTPTVVTYLVEPGEIETTRITLRHVGFTSRETCLNTCIGWETSFAQLAELLAAETAQSEE